MSLRILSLSQMVTLSAAWMPGGRQHALFMSVPVLAALFPQLEAIHGEAVKQQALSETDLQLADLANELTETDARHDSAVRAMWFCLTGAIEYLNAQGAGHAEEALKLERLRTQLMPDQLVYVRRTYLDEASYATRLSSELTGAVAAILNRIPVLQGTLLDVAKLWIEQGIRLGDLERHRSALQAGAGAQTSDYQVRGAWAELVGQMLSLLMLVHAPPEVVEALRKPVIDAVAAAEERQTSEPCPAPQKATRPPAPAPG